MFFRPKWLIVGAIFLAGCGKPPPAPAIFVAEQSPDQKKIGYVKEYYSDNLKFIGFVYPKYSLVIKEGNVDHEVFKIEAKELKIQFVSIAWNTDSNLVGFYIQSNNEPAFGVVAKAYDTGSLKELPFNNVEALIRNQISQRWRRYLPSNVDPLAAVSRPNERLSAAYRSWRIQHFGHQAKSNR